MFPDTHKILQTSPKETYYLQCYYSLSKIQVKSPLLNQHATSCARYRSKMIIPGLKGCIILFFISTLLPTIVFSNNGNETSFNEEIGRNLNDCKDVTKIENISKSINEDQKDGINQLQCGDVSNIEKSNTSVSKDHNHDVNQQQDGDATEGHKKDAQNEDTNGSSNANKEKDKGKAVIEDEERKDEGPLNFSGQFEVDIESLLANSSSDNFVSVFLIEETATPAILLDNKDRQLIPHECYLLIQREVQDAKGIDIWNILYLLGHYANAPARMKAAQAAMSLFAKLNNVNKQKATIQRKVELFDENVTVGQVQFYFKLPDERMYSNLCDLYLLLNVGDDTASIKISCTNHYNDNSFEVYKSNHTFETYGSENSPELYEPYSSTKTSPVSSPQGTSPELIVSPLSSTTSPPEAVTTYFDEFKKIADKSIALKSPPEKKTPSEKAAVTKVSKVWGKKPISENSQINMNALVKALQAQSLKPKQPPRPQVNIPKGPYTYCVVLRIIHPELKVHWACGTYVNDNTLIASMELARELSLGIDEYKIVHITLQEAYEVFAIELDNSIDFIDDINEILISFEWRFIPLYEITTDNDEPEVQPSPIRYSELKTHACYLLDTKSISGIFLWIGEDASLQTKVKAAGFLEMHFTEDETHFLSPVTIVEQFKESIDFKINFSQWYNDFHH